MESIVAADNARRAPLTSRATYTPVMAPEPLPVNIRILWLTFFRGTVAGRQLTQLKGAMASVVAGLLFFVWVLAGVTPPLIPAIPGAVLVVGGVVWARVLMWHQRR